MTGNTDIPFVASCAYPPCAGNAVRPLVDGVPAYRRIAETIMAARHSIWLTAAFVAPDFCMPDGSGTLFDVLDRAVGRGLDVRVISWRPNQESIGYASPESRAYDIARGERSVLAQYIQAIGAAGRSIYIENQAIPIPEVAAVLEKALKRGVEVVALVPADPEDGVRVARQDPQRKPLFDGLAALGRYENFALVGIAGLDAQGRRRTIYVHGKIMLIDDAWATIGSSNLHAHSLTGNTEMNAAIWDPKVVRALRCELLAEHLDRDTTGIDDRAALRLYGQIARENRRRRDAGDCKWQGLAFSLDPATYGG